MSGLEISSFVHLGWKNGKRAEARFLYLWEAPSPALPQNWEGSRAAKDHKVTTNTENSFSKHYFFAIPFMERIARTINTRGSGVRIANPNQQGQKGAEGESERGVPFQVNERPFYLLRLPVFQSGKHLFQIDSAPAGLQIRASRGKMVRRFLISGICVKRD